LSASLFCEIDGWCLISLRSISSLSSFFLDTFLCWSCGISILHSTLRSLPGRVFQPFCVVMPTPSSLSHQGTILNLILSPRSSSPLLLSRMEIASQSIALTHETERVYRTFPTPLLPLLIFSRQAPTPHRPPGVNEVSILFFFPRANLSELWFPAFPPNGSRTCSFINVFPVRPVFVLDSRSWPHESRSSRI